jgi:hypothetical protein
MKETQVLRVQKRGGRKYLYIPFPGQPGADVSGLLPGVQYKIISDVVPEPSSAVLLLSGGALFGLNVMRRKART